MCAVSGRVNALTRCSNNLVISLPGLEIQSPMVSQHVRVAYKASRLRHGGVLLGCCLLCVALSALPRSDILVS